MTNPTIKLKWLVDADPAIDLPEYKTAGAAGADVCANFPLGVRERGITLYAGDRALIPTGFNIEIEDGYEVQVRPRSGLALKQGITITNSPGTVDSDYRGPLGIILHNTGTRPFEVKHGDRIAQIVVAPVTRADFKIVDKLSDTVRGEGGYGSTGVKKAPEIVEKFVGKQGSYTMEYVWPVYVNVNTVF